jgi:hypothetical protein
MKPQADKTLADFVVIALSPVLIMALVGSLVFFLVEVLYVGQYEGRLLWILFFFVFGAVLVARIAIEIDTSRAGMYGLILGGVAWLGLQRYVVYPPGTALAELGWAIHVGLIGIIWWSTNRLTWDCTMIDDEEDASGEGLLQAAGLDDQQQAMEEKPDAEAGDTAIAPEKKPKRGKREESDLQAWWRRYQEYRQRRKRRPHVPGVWVVYFSLAALPLYGLGQSLIPPAEEERRRYAFWLMSIYVASGLGLLVTTSFLGLRRYLRQKKVQMPMAVTGVWLLLGAAMITCFLVLGALLPRPAAEYALIKLPWRAGSEQREASRFAQQGEEAGKDEGRPGAKGKEEQHAGGKDAAARKEKGGKDKGDGAASSPKKDNAGGGSDGKGKGQDKGGDKDKGASQARKGGAGEKTETKKDEQAKEDAKAASDQQGQTERPPPRTGSPALPEWIAKLAAILKWIVLAAFVLVTGFFLLRALLLFLANFTGWARSLLEFFRHWWQRLAGSRGAPASGLEPVAAPTPPPPFRTFGDPFLTGQAGRMSAAELVRYTFEALQAWAAERALARQTGETPLEFSERLAREVPELAEEARQLADQYAGLAYARQTVPDDYREPLRQLWLLFASNARRELRDESRALGSR